MTIKEIFQEAYLLMNTPVTSMDCGELCNYHCCRNYDEDGEELGIYMLPYEYESVIMGSPFEGNISMEKHTPIEYCFPSQVGVLDYIFCGVNRGCLREYRPIQCRTYPFEPYLEGGELYLVVTEDQLHDCPLLKMPDRWRKEFVEGIYNGWDLLVSIPEVRYLIIFESNTIKRERNIRWKFDISAIENWEETVKALLEQMKTEE